MLNKPQRLRPRWLGLVNVYRIGLAFIRLVSVTRTEIFSLVFLTCEDMLVGNHIPCPLQIHVLYMYSPFSTSAFATNLDNFDLIMTLVRNLKAPNLLKGMGWVWKIIPTICSPKFLDVPQGNSIAFVACKRFWPF